MSETGKPAIGIETGEPSPDAVGLAGTEQALAAAASEPELPNTSMQFEDEERPVFTPTAAPAPTPVPTSIDGDDDHRLNMEDEEEDEAPRIIHQLQENLFSDKKGMLGDNPIQVPTMGDSEIFALVTLAAELLTNLTEEQREALKVHSESWKLTLPDDVYKGFFERPNIKLVQALRTPSNDKLTMTMPPFKEPKLGQILDITEASSFAARLVSAYDYIFIIAHHSGMWLKVRVGEASELHDLLALQAIHRGEMGYSTRGSTLSTDTALRNMTFINWLIRRTISTNMQDSSQESIRRNLVAMDIQLLAQQMASALHPTGHPTERACSSKPGVCNHVERGVLRISKMQFIDEDRFTDKQRLHMQTLLRKGGLKTEQDMADYRKEFGVTINRRVDVGFGVTFTLAAPTIDLYENTAEEWASTAKRDSEDVLSLMSEQEATKHQNEKAALATMRRHGAWVESIELEGRLVQDRLAINAVMATFSQNKEIVERFVAGVKQYITDCTVAAVGVNDYKCPVCNGKQALVDSGMLSSIAPLDAVTAFFTLAERKIHQVRSIGTAY